MTGKRGNNEGSLTKRPDGRWEARVTLENGRRKSFYARTRQEASRLLTVAMRDLDQGVPIVGERQTVEQYLETWIKTIKSEVRGSSWRRYSDYVRIHLIPGLGKVALAKLAPQNVKLFCTRKLDEGLSATTVRNIHGMLHRALDDALRMGLVQRNVAEMVRAPRRATPEMATLTEEQARQFLMAITGDRFEALYILALTTGMRQGELLALRWQDVDLAQGLLHVRVNVQESDGRFIIAEVKTAYSRRNIALTTIAIEALRRCHAAQLEERGRLGPAWNTSLDLVFPNRVGGIMIPDNLAKRSFKQLLADAGLPTIRFHDLRHTAATLMLSRGVHPKVVSEMLGHADIAITLRVYAHVTPHMQQVAVGVMDAIFAGVIDSDGAEEAAPVPDAIGDPCNGPVGVNVGVNPNNVKA